jgi:hypothetical protein
MSGIPDPGNRGDDGSDPVFTQTLGVGGIAAPAAGPGVVLATADRATKLTITTPNTIFDGGGFQVTGGIDVKADGVTVQNFRINAQRQYGVYAEGKNITIQNNDIANVKVSGDKDLNAVTGFGENLRVLFNTAINFVTGDPGESHTDFFQTWISSSHPTGSTGLEVRGNKATGPANPSRLHSIASIHQCVMIEGRGRGGNTGGTGDTKNIIISDNEFGDSWNQCIKLDGVQGAIITRNKFTGSSDHVVAITSASSDIKYYSDNVVDGTYGNLGVPITAGAGPGAPSGGGSLAGAPIYPAQFPDGTAFPNFTEPASNQAVAVANASEFASKLASVQPGQTLVLADGTYDIGAVTISKTGTKTQPIVIKPLHAGGVKLASGNSIKLTGQYILVVGLAKEFDDSGKTFSFEGAAKFCGFDSCKVGPVSLGAAQPSAAKSLHYYGGGTAENCFITYCETKNKSKPGNGILVDGDFSGGSTGGLKHILIDHCYIHDYGTEVANEFEAIRFGVSTMQSTQSNSVIMRCYFENIKTEPEIISVKTSKLWSWGHTFKNCIGVLSLRHGNDCYHQDCYGFGPATGSGGTKGGGYRVYGQRNAIRYCYGEGLIGSSYESFLTIDGGDTSSPTNGHQNVVGGEFSNNVGVNNATGIVIGEHYSTAPAGIKVRDNIIVNSGGVAVKIVKAPTGTNDIANNTSYDAPAAAGLTLASGAYRKTGYGPRLTILTSADVGPAATSRTDGTGTSISGAAGGSSGSGDVAARVQAAQAIIDRMTSGQAITTGWTWSECPAVVTTEAPNLLVLYTNDGSPADQQAWLQGYISTNSGTGGGSTTSPAALLNIGKAGGMTRANLGIGFKAGDVPQPNPEGAPAGTAEHIDYDLTHLENGLTVPGYFEVVTVDGEQRVRMTVTGMGGRTSKKTGYDRVEFRALAENGVDKQGYDPTVKDFQSILYVAGYLMKSPPNKPQVCVAQLHDPDDDIAMVRFRNKTTVEAKLGDTVLGNLTTSYSLGTRYQALIRTTGKGGGKYDCELAWSQGTTPLPTSGPGYFKKSGISASTLFYQKAGDYGQSRVHGYTNKKPASSQGDEDASNAPLFIVDMTKLIMFTSEMGEPITKMD